LGRLTAVAVTEDTVRSQVLFDLFEFFKTNHVSWKFRKTTPEEMVMLDFKRRHAKYYHEETLWNQPHDRTVSYSKKNKG
jgi:hypothetical protein